MAKTFDAKWKFYYGDGSTFSNLNGSLKDVPARDVQLISQIDPVTGQYFQSGDDYYVWRDERWLGVDIFGLFDYLLDSGIVKFGRTVGNEEFQELFNQAINDPDFPPKIGRIQRERKP